MHSSNRILKALGEIAEVMTEVAITPVIREEIVVVPRVRTVPVRRMVVDTGSEEIDAALWILYNWNHSDWLSELRDAEDVICLYLERAYCPNSKETEVARAVLLCPNRRQMWSSIVRAAEKVIERDSRRSRQVVVERVVVRRRRSTSLLEELLRTL